MAKGRLRIAIEDFLNTFGFGDKIKGWIVNFAEEQEQETANLTSTVRSIIVEGLADHQELQSEVRELISGKHQGGIIAIGTILIGIIMILVQGVFTPFSRKVSYFFDGLVHTYRPDATLAVEMLRRSPDKASIIQGYLKDIGADTEVINLLSELTQERIPELDFIRLWRREVVSEQQLLDELQRKGWSKPDTELLKKASEYVPNVQDLIRIAVREGFNPEAISRFGLMLDLPPEYLTWSKRLGLTDDWAKRYWAAHWVLPSIQLGYEMYHRLRPGVSNNPFTIDDMRLLLRTADIAPNFHNRLIEISHTPITRVDIRRLYADGVIGVAKVYNSHLDLGYNEDNANLMTQWVIKDRNTDKKNLTRSAVIKSYKIGQSTYDEALQALLDIGYDRPEALFFVGLAKYELEQEEQEAMIEAIEVKYVEGQIDKNQAVNELAALGMPAKQISVIIAKFDVERLKQIRLPTRAELDSFYLEDIIDEPEYIQGLKAKRYPDDKIDWYLQKLDRTKAKEAVKVAEDAAKEQERLLTAEEKSKYREDKAAIDVQIAEVRLAIAELQSIKHDIEEPDVLTEIETRLVSMKELIAGLNLAKANLKYDLEKNI